MKTFRQKKNNEGILRIYKEIYNMSMFSKMKISGKTEKEMIEEIANSIMTLSREEWNWIYDTAERAAFSGMNVSMNDQKKMYHFYKVLRKEILKGFSWRRKLWFLYGRAM